MQTKPSIDFELLSDTLEATIDRYSLSEILAIISQICYEKSARFEAICIDKAASKEWLKAYYKLDHVVNSINV